MCFRKSILALSTSSTDEIASPGIRRLFLAVVFTCMFSHMIDKSTMYLQDSRLERYDMKY